MNGLMNRSVSSRAGEFQESKALSEIKGKMFLARQFPRDTGWSLQAALQECQRKELAEAAQYEFPKGDSVVKGPSIRLVEVLARHWGNLTSGVDEIESKNGETVIKAYAWDLETNVSDEKTFSVKHERTTRRGSYKLTDERDIYEMVANKGARRKRACLLAVLPGWYVDAAVDAEGLSDRGEEHGRGHQQHCVRIPGIFHHAGADRGEVGERDREPVEKRRGKTAPPLFRHQGRVCQGGRRLWDGLRSGGIGLAQRRGSWSAGCPERAPEGRGGRCC